MTFLHRRNKPRVERLEESYSRARETKPSVPLNPFHSVSYPTQVFYKKHRQARQHETSVEEILRFLHQLSAYRHHELYEPVYLACTVGFDPFRLREAEEMHTIQLLEAL